MERIFEITKEYLWNFKFILKWNFITLICYIFAIIILHNFIYNHLSKKDVYDKLEPLIKKNRKKDNEDNIKTKVNLVKIVEKKNKY